MKLKHLLPAVALALPLITFARPAKQQIQTVYNPDGTKLEIVTHGDEFFNYTTDAAGTMLVERGADGVWRQMKIDGRALSASAADINMLRGMRGIEYDRTRLISPVVDGRQRMAALDNEGRTTYPTIGEVHGLVILIEFSDVKFRIPNVRKAFDDMCNMEGYSAYGGYGSARDYYIAVSNGKFLPKFDVSEVVTLPNTQAYYAGIDENGNKEDFEGAGHLGRMGEAIQYAVKYLDEKGYDFSKYDYDKNDIIDNIFFFYAGFGQADQPRYMIDDNGDYIFDDKGNRIPMPLTIWPHQFDYNAYVQYPEYGNKCEPLRVDGKWMATYACSNELIGSLPKGAKHPYLDGVGAFCHEFGHVLGLPDLYDTDGNKRTKTPGYYDVMCSGSYNVDSTRPAYFSSYEQWLCNWLELDFAVDGTHYELKPLTESEDAVKVGVTLRTGKNSSSEYYLIENRVKDGWDLGLPEEGILIWHINYRNDDWWANKVNTATLSRVELMKPNDVSTAWPGIDGDVTVCYPGAANALVPMASNLSPKWGVYLTGIGVDPQTHVGSFDYNLITSRPEDVTVLHDHPTQVGTSREFVLEWDPVEGATNYYLTVYRIDSKGKQYFVDSLNDRAVGNITSRTVRNISSSAWDQEFHAYVRVEKLISSSKTSNEIVFYPANLSGIDEVGADLASISGGKGCINAPEGAQVYNMSGVRVSATDLPAGVYVVLYGGKSVKVVVK